MSLAKLVAKFEAVKELPIEVPEIRDAIISFGIQDNIVCIPTPSDPGKCRGVYYQFTARDGVYGETILTSLIVYSSAMDIPWQRAICAKEMIHIMDAQAEKTVTADEVQGLLDKLLGPMSTEDYGLADLMAAVDKLALYQSLTFLFPDTAREDARAKIAAGEKTHEQIAAWTALPIQLVRLVISDGWPDMKKILLQIE